MLLRFGWFRFEFGVSAFGFDALGLLYVLICGLFAYVVFDLVG